MDPTSFVAHAMSQPRSSLGEDDYRKHTGNRGPGDDRPDPEIKDLPQRRPAATHGMFHAWAP